MIKPPPPPSPELSESLAAPPLPPRAIMLLIPIRRAPVIVTQAAKAAYGVHTSLCATDVDLAVDRDLVGLSHLLSSKSHYRHCHRKRDHSRQQLPVAVMAPRIVILLVALMVILFAEAPSPLTLLSRLPRIVTFPPVKMRPPPLPPKKMPTGLMQSECRPVPALISLLIVSTPFGHLLNSNHDRLMSSSPAPSAQQRCQSTGSMSSPKQQMYMAHLRQKPRPA